MSNVQSTKKSPQIRFKGFEEKWEDGTIDKYGSFYYGRSCPKWSVSYDAPTPCIRYGEMYSKYGEKIEEVISHTNMPTDNLRFSTGKEVLVPRVGEDPMDYAHCTWLSVPNVAIGEMISVYNTEQHPGFTAIMFNATLRYEFARRVEGFTVTNLYYDKIKEIEVSFPTLNEQTKIYQLFSQIDSLIASTQKEHDKLVTLKKCMLKKMFPKKGSLVPEIRFKGFSGDWKEKKFSEIGTVKSGYAFQSENFEEQGIPVIRITNIKDGFISFEEIVKHKEFKIDNDFIAEKGDVLLAMSGATTGKIGVYDRNEISYINQRVGKFIFYDEKTCKYFFKTLFDTEFFMEQVIGSVATGAQPNIGTGNVENMIFTIPTSNEEQQKIGSYFQNLDNLISKQSAELEKLKNIKKTLLSKMFV